MALTPIPELDMEQNVGFDGNDTAPIIHSIRWRHLPSRYMFKDVNDVITYHQHHPLVIDIKAHSVSYLDIHFLKGIGIASAKAYLRFSRATDAVLIEEPLQYGEKGTLLSIKDDPNNESLLTMKGISFTQKDLGDGTPLYDFMSMAEEGIYEVWIEVKTNIGNELHLRIPFQWSNLIATNPGEEPSEGEEHPEDENPPLEEEEKTETVDEYYVTIIEGDSPFTKRPSTHFRMAGVGMLMNPACFKRIETPKQPPIGKPSDDVVIGDTPVPSCSLKIHPQSTTKSIGESVTFTLKHTNNSGILSIVSSFDAASLEEIGEGTYKVLKEGTFPVTFTVVYQDGQECVVAGTVVGKFTCDLTVDMVTASTVEVGETIEMNINHGMNTEHVTDITVDTPPEVTQNGDNQFTSNTAGVYSVKVIATYGEHVCEKTVTLEFKEKEPDNVISCGDETNGSKGYAEFFHPSTEEGIYYIEYDFDGAPDTMRVFAGDTLIYNTGSKVYKDGSPFAFYYKPSFGKLRVVMNEEGKIDSIWQYTMYCPSSDIPPEVIEHAPIVNEDMMKKPTATK